MQTTYIRAHLHLNMITHHPSSHMITTTHQAWAYHRMCPPPLISPTPLITPNSWNHRPLTPTYSGISTKRTAES